MEAAMTDAATWTDERVELLAKLWAEGLSASQIAAQLGGVSRNAVIGKVHRLGLSGRNKVAAPAPQRARKPARPAGLPSNPSTFQGNPAMTPRPAAQPETPPAARHDPAAEELAIPMSERVTIMELRESMCRWPLGDPTTPEFRFCGQRAITGLPYCAHHAQIAYQPAADRRRGDRRIAIRA
jgi:GcrA cell cycle regulator